MGQQPDQAANTELEERVPSTHAFLKTGGHHTPPAHWGTGETPRGSDLFPSVVSEFHLLGLYFHLRHGCKELTQGLASLPRVAYTTRCCLPGP